MSSFRNLIDIDYKLVPVKPSREMIDSIEEMLANVPIADPAVGPTQTARTYCYGIWQIVKIYPQAIYFFGEGANNESR